MLLLQQQFCLPCMQRGLNRTCADRFYAFVFMWCLGLMQVFCSRVNVASESIIFGDFHHTSMTEYFTCFMQLTSCKRCLEIFRSNNQYCVKSKISLNKVANCSHLNVPTPWIRCINEVLQAAWELCRCFCCSQTVCEKNYKWYLPFN